MATTLNHYRGGHGSLLSEVRWMRALQVGLAVGAILFLLTRGIPWVGSGAINPAIMGREVAPGAAETPLFSFGMIGLHLILSMLYALIIAPIVHGLRPWTAGLAGAVVGLMLYFINYALTGLTMDARITQSEWPSIVTHMVFGLVTAEAYKGFVRENPEGAPRR